VIYLDSTTRALQAVLAGAVTANQLEVTAFFFDYLPQSTTTLRRGATKVTSTNSTTDVTIVSAPSVNGIIRNIHTIFIQNKDTASATVTVKLDDSGTETLFVKQALAVGESLVYEDQNGWSVLGSGTLATVSPAQLTANTNNWNPTDLSTARVIRFSTDARRNITGLAGGAGSRAMVLHNVGTFPAVFKYEDSNSDSEKRFTFGITLGGNQSMEIEYDSTTNRWRLKAAPPDPVGAIRDFGGGTVPDGYLACDGSNVSRTTYAPLFNEVGTTWGTGDGSTTFTLPDFQRRTAVGSGGSGTSTLANSVGSTGGEETHTLVTAELAAHTHTTDSQGAHTHTVNADSTLDAGGASHALSGVTNELVLGNDVSVTTSSNGSHTHTAQSTGSGTAHNVMQPSAVTTKMIRY
jgi:microcystin-dependent protein